MRVMPYTPRWKELDSGIMRASMNTDGREVLARREGPPAGFESNACCI